MVFLRRLLSARLQTNFRDKLTEMLTEYCLEASVLVSVLGVLDSAIALGHTPGLKVLLVSFGVGLFFFVLACIIQANKFVGNADDTDTDKKEPT